MGSDESPIGYLKDLKVLNYLKKPKKLQIENFCQKTYILGIQLKKNKMKHTIFIYIHEKYHGGK